jgi:hypothetical protein
MVVGVLRPDEPEGRGRMQSMRAVAETALIAGGGAFLPLLLSSFGLPSASVWRASGLIVSGSWLATFAYAMRRFSDAGEGPQLSVRFVVSAGLVPIANVLLLWNVIAPTGAAGARHTAALVAALAISAERFVSTAFGAQHGGPAA